MPSFANLLQFGLPGLLAGIALIMLIVVIRVKLRSSAARRWPVASGQVISSSLVEEDNDGTIYYHPTIVYRYQVAGKTYEASRLAIGATITGYQHKNKAEVVTACYPTGSTVQVHHHPQKPQEAVLEFTATANTTLTLIAIFLLVLAAAIFAGVSWFASQ